jgi:hypothetical protein
MYLKRLTRRKNGKSHTYWALIESVRTAQGPRQRTVAYLGELGKSERVGWAQVGRLLDQKPTAERGLFDGPDDSIPEHVQVNVRKVRVENPGEFGEVWLGWTLWRALKLDELLEARIPKGREEIGWARVAAALALARFCEPSSELHIAERWYRRSALETLLGIEPQQINKERLYRGLDQVLPQQGSGRGHVAARTANLQPLLSQPGSGGGRRHLCDHQGGAS